MSTVSSKVELGIERKELVTQHHAVGSGLSPGEIPTTFGHF